jgi:hypothetical protein
MRPVSMKEGERVEYKRKCLYVWIFSFYSFLDFLPFVSLFRLALFGLDRAENESLFM